MIVPFIGNCQITDTTKTLKPHSMYKKNDSTFFIFDKYQTMYFVMTLKERDLLNEIYKINKDNKKNDSIIFKLIEEKNIILTQKDSLCNNEVKRLTQNNTILTESNKKLKENFVIKNRKLFWLSVSSLLLAALLFL